MTNSESQEWILFDNVRDNNLKLEYLPFNDATPVLAWGGAANPPYVLFLHDPWLE